MTKMASFFAIDHVSKFRLLSSMCLCLAFWTDSICAASWTNASTAHSASINIAQVPSSSHSPDPTPTATPEYNYFSAVASYASTSYGLGVFGNTTFRSVCPTAPHAEASSCFATCTQMAASCQTLHQSWSDANNEYQTKMNSKYRPGDSSIVKTIVETHPERLTTHWGYSTAYETQLTTIDLGSDMVVHTLYWPTTMTTTTNGKVMTLTTTATQNETSTGTLSTPYAIGGTGWITSVFTPHNYLVTSTQVYSWSFSQPSPSCSPKSWTDCILSKDCHKCTVSGGTVQLLYFPTTKTSSHGNVTSAPATMSTRLPETVVFENTTLTSGIVYISFHTAYANNACGTQIGGRYPGAILAMDPKSLRSINMLWGTSYSTNNLDPFHSSPYLKGMSFNLADLTYPVPASAYMAQPKCQNGPFNKCSIILDDYNPLLEVPPQIRSLDPAWKDCELDWEGLYDPPKPLHPAEVAAQATMPASGPVTTAAEPQSSFSSPAKQTSSPAPGHFTTAEPTEPQTTESASSGVGDPSAPPQSSQPAVPSASVDSTERSSAANQVHANPPVASDLPSLAPTGAVSVESSNTPSDTPDNSMPSDAVTPSADSDAPKTEHQSASISDPTEGPESQNTVSPPQIDSDMGSAGPKLAAADIAAQQGHSTEAEPQNSHSSHGAGSSAHVGAVEQSGTGSAPVKSEGPIGSIDRGTEASPSSMNPTQQGTAAQEQTFQASSRPDQAKTKSEANAPPEEQTSSAERVASIAGEVLTYGGDAKTIYGQLMTMKSDGVYWSDLPTGSSQAAPTSTDDFGLPTLVSPSHTASAVSEGASPAPTLAPSIPRLVFTFGEHTYTAIQTAGPDEAVIGKTTVSVGQAASLPGGMVSLNGEGLAMTPDSEESTEATKTISGRIGVVTQTEGNPTLELLQTSGNLVLNDMATFSSSNSLWRLSGMTLSAVPQGFVQVGGKNQTFSMSKTVLTQVGTSILDGKESTSSTAAMTTYSTLTYSELPGVTTATTATTASDGVVERMASNRLVIITAAVWFTVLFEIWFIA